MSDEAALPPFAEILPEVLSDRAFAGELTGARAAGDAGTDKVATGTVTPRTDNVSVGTSVFATASECGARGMAILVAYLHARECESMEGYLHHRVSERSCTIRISPDPEDVEGYSRYLDRHRSELAVQRAAVGALSSSRRVDHDHGRMASILQPHKASDLRRGFVTTLTSHRLRL